MPESEDELGAVHAGAGATVVDDQAVPASGSLFAITGLLFAVVYLGAWLLLRGSPSFDATDGELTSYYADPDNRRNATVAGLYVVPLAAIFFIWFMAALRDRYHRSARHEHTMLSSVHVVAGALVVTSLFTVAAVELAIAWLAESATGFDVDGARTLLAVREATSEIMALRSAAVFVLVSTARAVRSGLFPRSFAVASVATALALLLVHQSMPWVSVLFPLWVAGASLLVLRRRGAGPLIDEA